MNDKQKFLPDTQWWKIIYEELQESIELRLEVNDDSRFTAMKLLRNTGKCAIIGNVKITVNQQGRHEVVLLLSIPPHQKTTVTRKVKK